MCDLTTFPDTVASIYGLHLGDHDFRYIGQTTQAPHVRLAQHKRNPKYYERIAVSKWILKHGAENIQMCIIEEFNLEDLIYLDEREIFHIAQARTYYGPNLNLTDGGMGTSGHLGWHHTPEARAKISASNMGNTGPLGHKQTDEHRAKVAAAFRGKPKPPHVANMLRANSSVGHHVRWHTNRNLVNPTCVHCAGSSE